MFLCFFVTILHNFYYYYKKQVFTPLLFVLGGIAFALIRRRQFFSEKHRMKRFAGSSKLFMSMEAFL